MKTLEQIITKMKPGRFDGMMWVGKEYSKADMIADLRAVRDHEDAILELTHAIMSWEFETLHLSSTHQMLENRHAATILKHGDLSVKVMLTLMKDNPHHFFGFLERLTGVNPVPLEYAGVIPEMTAYWVRWGIENKIIE